MVMQDPFRDGHAPIATTKQIIIEEHEERSHAVETMQEDDYVEAMFHCAHCDYKTNDRLQHTAHMEISHTQDEPLVESKMKMRYLMQLKFGKFINYCKE